MSTQEPTVVNTLEDDTGERCVDILKHEDGIFTFAEYAGEDRDWKLVGESEGEGFKTEYAAYLAATKAIEWLID